MEPEFDETQIVLKKLIPPASAHSFPTVSPSPSTSIPIITENNQSSIPPYRTPPPLPYPLYRTSSPLWSFVVVLVKMVIIDGLHALSAIDKLFLKKITKKSNPINRKVNWLRTPNPPAWNVTRFCPFCSATLMMRFTYPVTDPIMQLHISRFTELSKFVKTSPLNEGVDCAANKK